MAVNEVCRLCLATDDLVWIFDEENKKLNIKDVILIATGIEIHKKDVISQKICEKCYHFSIKIFQFRGNCLKADKYLKGVCMDYLVDKKMYIPNTEVSIKSISVKEERYETKKDIKLPSSYTVHPSVVSLCQKYPKMKLPRACLPFDIVPVVEMELDQVENYYKRLNIDFNQFVKESLLSSKISTASIKEKSLKQQHRSVFKTRLITTNTFSDNKHKEPICFKEEQNQSRMKRSSAGEIDTKKELLLSSEKRQTSPAKYDIDNISSSRKRKFDTTETCNYTEADLENATTKSLDKIPTKKRKLSASKDKCDENTVLSPNLKLALGEYKFVDTSTNSSIYEEILTTKDNGQSNCLTKTNSTNWKLNKIASVVKETCLQSVENTIKEKVAEESLPIEVASVIDIVYENDDYDSLTSVGKSVPLFVCHICNSVQYNMHDLKKHQNKHMRCQFCKVKFRSMQSKTLHIENDCLIRKIMNDLPRVELLKVEYNKQIRRRYPAAFSDFSPLADSQFLEVPNNKNDGISFKKALFKDFPPEILDVIEILSDDDAPLLIEDNELLPIVPDINIRDNRLLPNLKPNTTDKHVLRELISTLTRGTEEVETQTVLLLNSDVKIVGREAVLENLLPYLSTYMIPVKLKFGEFKVTYDFSNTSDPVKNKLCHWDDLTPICAISKNEISDNLIQ